jgi:hypothetical protein
MILFQLDANYIQRFISILNTYCQVTNSYKATVTDDIADDPLTPAVTYEYRFKWALAVPNGTPYDVSVKVTNEPGITQESIQMEQVVLTGSVIYSDVLKLDDEEYYIEVPGSEAFVYLSWFGSTSTEFLTLAEKMRMTLPHDFSFEFRKISDFGAFDNLALATIYADEYVSTNGGSTIGIYWRATADMILSEYSTEAFQGELLDKNTLGTCTILSGGWLIIVRDEEITGSIRHVLFKVVNDPVNLWPLETGNILPRPDLYPLNFGIRIERETPASPPEDPFFSYYGITAHNGFCKVNGIQDSDELLTPSVNVTQLIEEYAPKIDVTGDAQNMTVQVVRIPGDPLHDFLCALFYANRTSATYSTNMRRRVHSLNLKSGIIAVLISNISKRKTGGFEYLSFTITWR